MIEARSMSKVASAYVVNHEYCFSCIITEEHQVETLDEIRSYAELKSDPRADLPSSFTICSSVMTTYGSGQIFFTLLGKDGNKWLGSLLKVNNKTTFYHGSWVQEKLPPVFAHQWVRSCMTVNSESGLLQWVVDGVLVENATFAHVKNAKNKPTDLTGKIVLGAWQSSGAKKWISESNQVRNLDIFSTALSIGEMQQHTMGRNCSPEGDYLGWGQMRWNLKGQVSIETVDEKEPCMGHPSFNLYPARYSSMESCKHFCQKMGSRSPPVVTLEQWTNLQRVLDGLIINRGAEDIWLALNDTDTEEKWVDNYDGNMVNFSLPWASGEPNGWKSENCAVLFQEMGILFDYPCDDLNWAHACMCERYPTPYLRLRGLCSKSSVQDTLYQPMNSLTDFTRLTLVGLRTSIEFDDKEMTWTLSDKESNVTGISGASHKSFTLGRHNWTIREDMGCSIEGKEYTTELKMSGCLEGNFTCNDGQCVSMDQRCDQLPDCRDKSDEENCNIVVLEKSYNKNVPPIISQNEGANVSVSIDILKLVDIKEEDYSIEIQFSITLTWKENRATYHNLKHRTSLNALTKEEIHKLWLPKVIYENTDQKDTTRLGDREWEWETRVVVDRQGNFTRSEVNVVDEIEVFNGVENNLIMSQTYTREFQCAYDFSRYPFDTQV